MVLFKNTQNGSNFVRNKYTEGFLRTNELSFEIFFSLR